MLTAQQIRCASLSHHLNTAAAALLSSQIFILFQKTTNNQKACKRNLSSRSERNSHSSFQLDALPFRISPHEAYTKFQNWANNEQGLGPFLKIGVPIGSATISAGYAPFWYFDLNIRFVPPSRSDSRSTNIIPEPFKSAYPSTPNGIIHIPGLASYAGFSYRRSLIDKVHNTTLVFMYNDITPFATWMLEPLKYHGDSHKVVTDEKTIDIFPDPWNATRERSLSVIHEELVEMANELNNVNDENSKVKVQIERLGARRIYMPTYIVDYKILGMNYRAFISGCDSATSVSGISHKTIFSDSYSGQNELFRGASSFLSQKAIPLAGTAVQFFGVRPIVAVAQLVFNVLARLAMKLHVLGFFGGLYITYQKIVRPYLHERESSEKWERQRDHEAKKHSFSYHSFSDYDGSAAQRYFTRNRERILRRLGGEEGREKTTSEQQGNSWYQQWEEWAREQFEQAQREASRAQQEWQRQQQQSQYKRGDKQQYTEQKQYKQHQQTGRQYKQKAAEEEKFNWDFDVNDPWQVLGVSRNAPREEVSKAFRRVSLY